MAPTVSTQSKRGRSETYDGRSGKGMSCGLSAAICSSGGGGRDGSAGSGSGGINVATGKLGSAGSGGGGIAASGGTSGRIDVSGSDGDDNSMAGGIEGNVGSAGLGAASALRQGSWVRQAPAVARVSQPQAVRARFGFSLAVATLARVEPEVRATALASRWRLE